MPAFDDLKVQISLSQTDGFSFFRGRDTLVVEEVTKEFHSRLSLKPVAAKGALLSEVRFKVTEAAGAQRGVLDFGYLDARKVLRRLLPTWAPNAFEFFLTQNDVFKRLYRRHL